MHTRLFALALAAAWPAAQAAGDDVLARCRGIQESAARLACYDAIPLSPATPGTAPARPAAAPPAAASEVQRFGLPATSRPEPLEAVESRIDGHFEGWYPGTRIRLANGQVWQVTDSSSRFADVDNPKVTVRRGALGSFFLDIDGVNPSPRVRRVE